MRGRSSGSRGFVTVAAVVALLLASLIALELRSLRAKLQAVEGLIERIEARVDV